MGGAAGMGLIHQRSFNEKDALTQGNDLEILLLGLATGIAIGLVGGFLGTVYQEFCCCRKTSSSRTQRSNPGNRGNAEEERWIPSQRSQ
ncbi:MAG: hypothetical protein ACYCQI_13295 [Gammaproteobacteria bacterium]